MKHIVLKWVDVIIKCFLEVYNMEVKTKCSNCGHEKTWHVKVGYAFSQEMCEGCHEMGTIETVRV